MGTNMREWFKEARYGMMIHWGLYSLLAGEWKDQRCGNYAEWIQTRCRKLQNKKIFYNSSCSRYLMIYKMRISAAFHYFYP